MKFDSYSELITTECKRNTVEALTVECSLYSAVVPLCFESKSVRGRSTNSRIMDFV